MLLELEIVQKNFIDVSNSLPKFFYNKKSHESCCNYIKGLISQVKRKNIWQISEAVAEKTPYRYQNFIGKAAWNGDGIRDHTQILIAEKLGKTGVLTFDETGFLKKGKESAGVKRQYSGTAGRIENCQIGVFAAWKTDKGHSLIDRDLYIPEDWINDAGRCKKAGIPEEKGFFTKPQLASRMYCRIISNGFKPEWVTTDECYGRDPDFRSNLEKAGQPYVLAVPKDYKARIGLVSLTAEKWFAKEEIKWERLSCGEGSKGDRVYDWGLIKTSQISRPGFSKFLLSRRHIRNADDMAYYTVFSKKAASIQDVVTASGKRWSVEECFEMAKGEAGLDQYEVRNYTGWYRHITLSILALGILVCARAELLDAISQDMAGNGIEKSDDRSDGDSSKNLLIPVEKKGSMEEFKKKRQVSFNTQFRK